MDNEKYRSLSDPGITYFSFQILLTSTLLLFSCHATPVRREDLIDRSATGVSDVELDFEAGRKAKEINLFELGILELEPEDGDKFEGDIANNFEGRSVQEWVAEQNDPRRNAIKGNYNLWDNGYNNRGTKRVIPYVIDNVIKERFRNIIAKAMDQFHTRTCIRFEARNGQKDYIHIKSDPDGCFSYVGRMGSGPQVVNLDEGCFNLGTIMHELNHAVGFFHEHSRNDRDDWIEIHWENLKAGTAGQFEKYSLNTITHLGVSYDYGSIMHYRPTAFSKNGLATISAKKPQHPDAGKMGNREKLSGLDVSKINKLYQCPERVEGLAVTDPPAAPVTTTKESPAIVGLKCEDLTWRCWVWALSVFDYCDKYMKIKYEICRKSCHAC